MQLTPEQREIFRKAILSVLDTNASDFGLGLRAIAAFLPIYGFNNARGGEILPELNYLVDKEFAARVGKQISPENTAWRITATGRDFLAANES